MAGEAPAPDFCLDLAEAYREHRAVIYDYLWRRTGDRQLAEDLVQDVFADALVARPSRTKDRKPLLAWLYVVARRRAIDAARAQLRHPRVPLETAAVAVEDDHAAVGTTTIVEAIRTLPDDQRRLVHLRLLQGRSFAEIEETLGTDAAVCRVRFSRALCALRERLVHARPVLVLGLLQLVTDELPGLLGCI